MKFRYVAVAALLALKAHSVGAVQLYSASLQNGDYGAGDQIGINPVGCPQTGACAVAPTGIVDNPDGAQFTGPEALINYALASDHPGNQASFRSQGTVSVRVYVDSAAFDSGSLFEDNYGYGAFRGGQATFGSTLSTSGSDVALNWNVWISNVWYPATSATFAFDGWHHVGLAWGGPSSDLEICIDGQVATATDLPPGVTLPWGGATAAENFGLGTNHERGFDVPASLNAAEGVTYADLEIWDQHVLSCATDAPPVIPPSPAEAIPTLTTWSFISLAVLTVLAGLTRLRRTA